MPIIIFILMQKIEKCSCSEKSISTQDDKNEGSGTASRMSASLKIKKLRLNSSCSKFRFHGVVYSEGDAVMLSNGQEDYFVAKIVKFNPRGGIPAYKYWPTIQVQWYYRKSDIMKGVLPKEDLSDYLSEYEVFESSHLENVIIESIISKCSVTTLEKYEKMQTDSNVFFTRAAFNHKNVNEAIIYY